MLETTKWGKYFTNICQVEKYFNTWSIDYDSQLYNTVLPQVILQDVLPLVNNCETIVDYGCGTGFSGQFFKPLCNKLVGFDLSNDSLLLALEKGYTQVEQCDLLSNVPLVSNVDTVISFGLMGDYIPALYLLPILFQNYKESQFIITVESSSTPYYRLFNLFESLNLQIIKHQEVNLSCNSLENENLELFILNN